jgi:serine/threonine protein kinase
MDISTVVVFGAISAWILIPKWLRYKQELHRERLLAQQTAQPPEDVKKLRERVENLEGLLCRLDSEINYQLEKSVGGGRLVTTPGESGNSQMPTTFLNVAGALESRFQILQELGRGGMGIVFQAHDKQLKEQVAIKVLSPLLSNNGEALERLKREVSAARRVTHPNVIRIHDISEMNGLHFVSMEYFRGTTLRDLVRQSGAMGLQQGFNIASQICDGLEAAHRQGVIHRDLKSQNIIVDGSGHAKIIDFGLAHSMHAEGLTATGLIMGTPEYMAPEQVAGKRVDERADVYSLGIILFEMFTGKVPFTGDSAIAIGFKQMKEEPPKPRVLNSQISEPVEDVILKALQKEPQFRYASVAALRQDLEVAVSTPAAASVAGADVSVKKEQRIRS